MDVPDDTSVHPHRHLRQGLPLREGPRSVPRGAPYSLTFNIAVLDHAVSPVTGFPGPGGSGSREAAALARRAASRGTLVAMDVVEVNPLLDPSRRAAHMAARLDGTLVV